jgi:hypothetical protein
MRSDQYVSFLTEYSSTSCTRYRNSDINQPGVVVISGCAATFGVTFSAMTEGYVCSLFVVRNAKADAIWS